MTIKNNSGFTHDCGRDVTVAVHVSADRLEALTQTCQYWDGAVSAAVYALPGEDAAVAQWCANDKSCNCQSGADNSGRAGSKQEEGGAAEDNAYSCARRQALGGVTFVVPSQYAAQ